MMCTNVHCANNVVTFISRIESSEDTKVTPCGQVVFTTSISDKAMNVIIKHDHTCYHQIPQGMIKPIHVFKLLTSILACYMEDKHTRIA